MRKLISLLTVLTLTTPVPLNVIACGPNTPVVFDENDYVTLAQTAKEMIQVEFSNLVNSGSNLRKVGDVTKGNEIMKYLQQIKQADDKQIDNKDVIDGFLEFLKAQVLTMSNNLIANYSELKPLFNGINPNDLDKLLTNKKFSWEGNDFV